MVVVAGKDPGLTFGRFATLFLVALALAGCQEPLGSVASDVPPPPEGSPQLQASQACEEAWVESHARESSGVPTPEAFLPSIRTCRTLAEWSAAARDAGGHTMQGREAQFVASVCQLSGAEVQALQTCKEAEARFGLNR